MGLEDGIFTFGNGVRLKLKKPSDQAVEGLKAKLHRDDPEPQPPVVYIEAKGRDEPNANDPDYRVAFIEWSNRTGMKVTEVLILTGTERDGNLPDGVYGPDSDELVQWLDAMGLGLPENPSVHQKYIAWVKYYVATADEFKEMLTDLIKFGGVSEDHIKEAEDIFRRRAYGAADSQSPTN